MQGTSLPPARSRWAPGSSLPRAECCWLPGDLSTSFLPWEALPPHLPNCKSNQVKHIPLVSLKVWLRINSKCSKSKALTGYLGTRPGLQGGLQPLEQAEWSHPPCGTLSFCESGSSLLLCRLFSWVQQQGPHPTAAESKSLAFPLLPSKPFLCTPPLPLV